MKDRVDKSRGIPVCLRKRESVSERKGEKKLLCDLLTFKKNYGPSY